jgi:hypothetical protein
MKEEMNPCEFEPAASEKAAANGHDLGPWRRYSNGHFALCPSCGAIVIASPSLIYGTAVTQVCQRA